ncbi:hypothetical protein J2X46_000182 [Nocardioides sp. BE266]|uniref:hypothetical protein n=1 Tax=Nocardioides sp. BE266 TaxID=2817725 RepID=UPI0028677142|nr:hypothetical protein [Nocardioides sp. BE266]MDR7251210.1 hypothetical protein [Nocardioides sp. BE266]
MPRPSPGRTPRARLAALVLVLVLPLSAACSSSSDPEAAPERLSRGDDQVSLASHPVQTKTKIHRVYGRLGDAKRKAVRRQVGKAVDRWWEAAYLGGTYPRSSFPSAFPGFTKGAEKRARSDKALLTNETGGHRIDAVEAKHRAVTLDILATRRQARSVTAHFTLRFDTRGDKTGTTTVRGRLFLVRRQGAWRIFGYDVAKGAR